MSYANDKTRRQGSLHHLKVNNNEKKKEWNCRSQKLRREDTRDDES